MNHLTTYRDYTDKRSSRLYRVDRDANVHLVKELPNMVIWAMETGKDFLALWASCLRVSILKVVKI